MKKRPQPRDDSRDIHLRCWNLMMAGLGLPLCCDQCWERMFRRGA